MDGQIDGRKIQYVEERKGYQKMFSHSHNNHITRIQTEAVDALISIAFKAVQIAPEHTPQHPSLSFVVAIGA